MAPRGVRRPRYGGLLRMKRDLEGFAGGASDDYYAVARCFPFTREGGGVVSSRFGTEIRVAQLQGGSIHRGDPTKKSQINSNAKPQHTATHSPPHICAARPRTGQMKPCASLSRICIQPVALALRQPRRKTISTYFALGFPW